MKKKILLFSIIVLLLALAAGVHYINATLVPTVLKDKIVSGLSEAVGTRVTLESVRIHLLRGIILTGLVIPDKTDPASPLLRVQSGSGSLLILPLIREKKFIIPSVRVDKADVHLVRQKDNTWNISSFSRKSPAGPGTPMPMPLVKNISIHELTITLRDDAPATPQTYVLRVKNINGAASLKTARIQGQGELQHNALTLPLELLVEYTFIDGKTSARVKTGSLDAALLQKTFGPWPWPVSLDQGALTQIEADISMGENMLNADLETDLSGLSASKDELSLKDATAHIRVNIAAAKDDLKNFTANGTLDIAGASVSHKGTPALQAGLGASSATWTFDKNALVAYTELTLIDANGTYETLAVSGLNASVIANIELPFVQTQQNSKAPGAVIYSGSAKIASGVIDGVPSVKKISSVTGTLAFDNNGITIDNAVIGVFEAIATISAKYQYVPASIEADIQGEFDLSDAAAFIPPSTALPEYEVSGAAEIQAHISTPLPTENALPDISGEALLKDVWFRQKGNPTTYATDKARVKFDTAQEDLEWHTEAVIVNNAARYSSDGTLKGFTTPLVNTLVIGPDFKVQTEFTKNKNMLSIASFKGQMKNSNLDASGSFNLDGQRLDIRGKAILDLGDIPLKTRVLQGTCALDITCQGPLKNFRKWILKASGSSGLITGYGYTAKNITLSYEQADGIGIINDLTFTAYGGEGLIKGRLDLAGEAVAYALRGVIEKLDLGALKLDTPMKDKTLYGTLGLKMAVQGTGSDAKTLKGGGHFTITNGNIWEFNPLKELGTFLFAPRFGKLTFTTAEGDFFIHDNAVTTDNLELLGPELSLLIDGRIGFDGSLDILINSQVPMPGPLQKLEETKLGNTIAKAGSLTAIEVKGTTQKPKYKLLPIRANIVKRIGDVVSNILP